VATLLKIIDMVQQAEDNNSSIIKAVPMVIHVEIGLPGSREVGTGQVAGTANASVTAAQNRTERLLSTVWQKHASDAQTHCMPSRSQNISMHDSKRSLLATALCIKPH
jgi:hypothetical protein